MSQDQISAQDPTSRHVQPDALPDQQIEHPGLESEMALKPDYGESTYRGSGRQEARELSSPVVIPGSAGRGAGVRPEGADVLISYLPAHLDAADPGDHAGGTGRLLRREDPHRPYRTAGGTRLGSRVPGFPGVQLHHRRARRCHRGMPMP